jgi:uncharacterized membrane protein
VVARPTFRERLCIGLDPRVADAKTKTGGRLWWASRIFLLVFSLLGLVAAFYLTLMHYRGGIPHCYVFAGCATVQTSKYSAVWGIPIALPGTLYFAIMFGLGIALLVAPSAKLTLTYKIVAFAGALAAIPLFLLQAVVLRAYCTYCLVAEIAWAACWLASLTLRGPRGTAGQASKPTPPSKDEGGAAGP